MTGREGRVSQLDQVYVRDPSITLIFVIMKPSVHSPCGIPASGTVSAQLFHIILVFCATGLMMVIAIFALISAFLLRLIDPTPTSRRAGRTPRQALSSLAHEDPARARAFNNGRSEDPLRALTRICDFLACNTARARKRGEFDTTPPLAGLGLYLDAMRVDLAHIDEMEDVPRAGVDAVAGVGADTNAHDEPGLVVPPHQPHTLIPFLHLYPNFQHPLTGIPPRSLLLDLLISHTTDSTPYHRYRIPTMSHQLTTATTATSTPRKRKDAVFRVPKRVSDPDHADADSAAVRAAAVLAHFADLGAGLEGTVRKRGAAFITKMII
ncbi:hypothetical protein BGW80DRAFT_1561026 [Lactifluus volemus]|nr:hypothetical protein BGW80DRAFT_1561026 [Lactifluus volemus]